MLAAVIANLLWAIAALAFTSALTSDPGSYCRFISVLLLVLVTVILTSLPEASEACVYSSNGPDTLFTKALLIAFAVAVPFV